MLLPYTFIVQAESDEELWKAIEFLEEEKYSWKYKLPGEYPSRWRCILAYPDGHLTLMMDANLRYPDTVGPLSFKELQDLWILEQLGAHDTVIM